MNQLKSFWSTITGSISSLLPLFFTVCKSGACGAVCVSPIASILGISSATLIASPVMQSLFPVLLVFSAVSFTISYFQIYILPKYESSCNTDCACDTKEKSFQYKFSVWSFWIGLVASIVFFSYFEFQNYKARTAPMTTITISDNHLPKDSLAEEPACCSGDKKCK